MTLLKLGKRKSTIYNLLDSNMTSKWLYFFGIAEFTFFCITEQCCRSITHQYSQRTNGNVYYSGPTYRLIDFRNFL
jgi:hypothetical protein